MADIVERLLTSTDSLGHAAAMAIKELRKKLAEAELARDAYRFEMGAAQSILFDRGQQLLATQAHAARLVEALKAAEYGDGHFDHRGDGQCYCPECGEKKGCAHSQNCIIGKALSTPSNLDALHEALACECERLLDKWVKENHRFFTASTFLQCEAAAHRAKKEGK